MAEQLKVAQRAIMHSQECAAGARMAAASEQSMLLGMERRAATLGQEEQLCMTELSALSSEATQLRRQHAENESLLATASSELLIHQHGVHRERAEHASLKRQLAGWETKLASVRVILSRDLIVFLKARTAVWCIPGRVFCFLLKHITFIKLCFCFCCRV